MELDELDLDSFSTPIENEIDLDAFSAPVMQDTGQSLAASSGNQFLRDIGSVIPNIIGGIGDVSEAGVRNWNPVAWAAKAGVPGAQSLVDLYSKPGEFLSGTVADSMTGKLEEMTPTNPLYADSFTQKASGAVGQGVGQLASFAVPAKVLGLAPSVARAVGLSGAFAQGAKSGTDTAEAYGIEDDLTKAAMTMGFGGIETVTEMAGGLGAKGPTEAILGMLRSATRPGTAATRAAKTIASEFGEEMAAGQGQDWLTGAVVQEDPNRPGFATNGVPLPPDTFTMENLKNRLEEGALGAIGGAVFAGAEALGSRTPIDEALAARFQARTRLEELRQKDSLTTEEQDELSQIEAEDQNVAAWLNRQGIDRIRPIVDQFSQNPQSLADTFAKMAEDQGREKEADVWRSERGLQQATEEISQYKGLMDALSEAEAAGNVEAANMARDAMEDHVLGTLNPLSRPSQDRSLGKTVDERIAKLKARVQAANPVERAAMAAGDAMANEVAKDAPQTARALQEVLKTPLPSVPQQTKQDDASEIQSTTQMGGIPSGPEGTGESGTAGMAVLNQGQAPAGTSPQEEVNAPVPPSTQQPTLAQPTAEEDYALPPLKSQLNKAPIAREDAEFAKESYLQTNPERTPFLQNAWIGSTKELAQDKQVRDAVIAGRNMGRETPLTSAQEEQEWRLFLMRRHEGFQFGDRPYILLDRVVVTDRDLRRSIKYGMKPEQWAVRRLIAHEDRHVLTNFLAANEELGARFRELAARIPDAQLDDLANRRYPEFSDWRTSEIAKRSLQLEWFSEQAESDSPTDPTLLQQFLELLRELYAKVMGISPEDVQDVELRQFLKRASQLQAEYAVKEPKKEESGRFSVYQTRDRWAVQMGDERGPIGDPLFRTKEEAEKESALLKKREESRRAASDVGRESAKIKKTDPFNGFTKDLPPLQRGKVEKALESVRSVGNTLAKVHEVVEAKIRDGFKVTSKTKPDGSIEKRLSHEDGRFLTQTQVSKTGMDYAEWLLSEKKGSDSGTSSEIQENIRFSTPEDSGYNYPPVPDTPDNFQDWIPVVDKARAKQLAWESFYRANADENGNVDLPAITAAWKQEIARPDSPYLDAGQTEAFMEARRKPAEVYDEPRELTAPETGPRQTKRKAPAKQPTPEDIASRYPQFSQPELSKEERLKAMDQRARETSYETVSGQQEGLSPTQATQDKRTFATDGEEVDFSRAGTTNAQIQANARDDVADLMALSPDGPSLTMGKDLMDFLSGKTQDIYGYRGNDLSKVAMINYLETEPQLRGVLGIDMNQLRRIRSQEGSVAGAVLQTFRIIYNKLQKLWDGARELEEKTAKEEFGTADFQGMAEEVGKDRVKLTRENAKENINAPVKTSILESAQDDADELMALGLAGMDPKLAAKIREINERTKRLGQLRDLERKLMAGSEGFTQASLPELPENMTLAEVRALIKKEEQAIEKLVKEIDAAQKKSTSKPKERKNQKVADNASFREWVEGKETAGLDSFDDLMLKYINPAGFNRLAFTSLLTNKFQNADPSFILGVVSRIGDLLDGSTTQEAIENDAKKAPNYDARAKRIVGTSIARQSTETSSERTAEDPLVALTARRLKGEISVADFRKEAEALGIEPETGFALLQKIDEDRARIGDAKAQREINVQAKKDMAKAAAAAQKADKEAQAMVNQLAREFSDTPDLSKKQAGTDLKALVVSFMGKQGPPISEAQFLERAAALNLKPQSAQNLLRMLQEARRRDTAVRYAKASQQAQEAKRKAIESMVKKLSKVKNPTPRQLKKRSKFINLVAQAMNSGILESESVRAALAEAYDLHGLTEERVKELGDLYKQIDAMPGGMAKETLHLQLMQLLNDLAPASSISSMAFSAYMGYVLQGAGTMLMQTSNLLNFLSPFAFAHNVGRIYASTQGNDAKKLFSALNLRRNFQLTAAGMKESWENAALIKAGLSGIKTSTGQGLGVTPTELTQSPFETSLAWTPWGQIGQFRMDSNKLMKSMGVLSLFKAARFPAWMASRSFQVIRGAEGWSGGVEKNMAFRQIAVTELQKQGKTYDEAWRIVSDALSPKTNDEMWKDAYKQADEDIKNGLVNKAARKQRATELVQDELDKKWDLMLADRHRQQSAVANFKTDPLTPMGAGAYKLVSMALEHHHWGPVPNPLRFGFLFPRFFINAMETSFMYSPVGLMTSLALPKDLPESKLKERQQRIIEIYGSLSNYRDARIGKSLAGTTVMAGVGALMAAAMQMWDEDDDEPPLFWISGDLLGRYDRRGTLAETGWWTPNTMYIMGQKFNYVNSSPQFSMILNAAGNLGDRFMFPKLLKTKLNARTKELEYSVGEAWVRPFGEALAAPMSRSTYRTFYDALDNAMGGDFKKLIRLATQPATGTATALTLGAIPSLKTFEKAEKSQIQPRSPQDIGQTLQAGVPFANSMGLDTGKPLFSVFGEPLTPYHFLTVAVNEQQTTPEARQAARVLIDLGISKNPQKFEYLGNGAVEIAYDGKFYLLSNDQRNEVIKQIGQGLAASIVREKDKLKKLQATKGRNAVNSRIDALADEARKKALRGVKGVE